MAKKTNPETWNSFAGLMRVYSKTFRKQKYPSLSCGIGHKREDGEFDNLYFKVRLAADAKELELEDGENWLAVENGFITCESYEDAKGNEHTVAVIVITSAELVEAPEREPAKKTKNGKKKKASSDDDEED